MLDHILLWNKEQRSIAIFETFEVVCDFCNELFVDGDERTGGRVHHDWAICPLCAPKSEPQEIDIICPEGQSFFEFINNYRACQDPNYTLLTTWINELCGTDL